MSGGHFEATPPHQSETSLLWRAISLLTLTVMIFTTLKSIGNQVSAPLAASLLTICVYVCRGAINECRHDRRVKDWQRGRRERTTGGNDVTIKPTKRVEGHTV